MGCSFDNDVLVVCEKDEREWFNTLQGTNHYIKEVPASHFEGETPVWLEQVSEDGTLIYISSKTYGTMDLSEVRLPDSCVGVVSSVYSCQGDDINFVETIHSENFGEDVWSPYGKLDIDFNRSDTMPKETDDETDEEHDRRMEEHTNTIHKLFAAQWIKCQQELGVKTPMKMNISVD
jgi:hypothetical protein